MMDRQLTHDLVNDGISGPRFFPELAVDDDACDDINIDFDIVPAVVCATAAVAVAMPAAATKKKKRKGRKKAGVLRYPQSTGLPGAVRPLDCLSTGLLGAARPPDCPSRSFDRRVCAGPCPRTRSSACTSQIR